VGEKPLKTQLLEQLVKGQKTLVELVKENAALLSGYNRLKADFNEYLKDSAPARSNMPTFIPNPWGRVLFSARKSKRRHYWIYSDKPNLGKTFLFAKPLCEQYRAFISSNREQYWNLTGDEQVLILDEYNTAQYKFSELNCMCDGFYSYRKFMGGVIKLNNPLIIVLSNQHIDILYPHMNELLHARFNSIKLD